MSEYKQQLELIQKLREMGAVFIEVGGVKAQFLTPAATPVSPTERLKEIQQTRPLTDEELMEWSTED